MVKNSFGPDKHLKTRSDINRCKERGKKIHAKHFLLLALPNDLAHSRLAVAVTTKLDKRAVVRNRLKRRIKEVFRLNHHRLKLGLDMLIVARRDATSCCYDDCSSEILGALEARGYLIRREK